MLSYQVASFFSGIGGFDLGLERAGFDVVFQCEVKPFCLHILEKHWPEVPRVKDIREVDYARIPHSDVWAAGFPCQDLSVARMGPRSGLRGNQSGLFYDFMELVGRCRPRAVILENVHGLLTSHGGRDFAIVLKTLDELGYGVAWRVLNSRYFGVPQQRRRVYVVALYRDGRGPGQVLFEPECGGGNAAAGTRNGPKPLSPFKISLGDPERGPIVKALAHCIYAESARHTGTDWSRNYVCYPQGRVRRFTPNEVERVQGFPDDWTAPEGDAFGPNRLDSLRYHAIGNAVTPSVAQWVGQRLYDYLSVTDGLIIQEKSRHTA